MAQIVEAKHDGIEGTAQLSAQALAEGRFPGWEPVSKDDADAVKEIAAELKDDAKKTTSRAAAKS